MKKLNIIKTAAIALLFTQAAFGQTLNIKSDSESGVTWDNPIVAPLETTITGVAKEPGQLIRFVFDAPVAGMYSFSTTLEDLRVNPGFLLLNQKGKIIEKGVGGISKFLQPGRHRFSVRLDGYTAGKPFSIMVTQYRIARYKPDKFLTDKFANAAAAPLYEDIEIASTEKNQSFYYHFEVTGTAVYQIRGIEQEVGYKLFDSKFRNVEYDQRVKDHEIGFHELLPGKYYLTVTLFSSGEKCHFVVTRQGEHGWKKRLYIPDPMRLFKEFVEVKADEWTGTKFGFLGTVAGILAMIIVPLILFIIVYIPYNKFLKRKYRYSIYTNDLALLAICLLVYLIIINAFTLNFVIRLILTVVILIIDFITMSAFVEQMKKLNIGNGLIVLHIILIHILLYIAAYFIAFLVVAIVGFFILSKSVDVAASASSKAETTETCTCGCLKAKGGFCPQCGKL